MTPDASGLHHAGATVVTGYLQVEFSVEKWIAKHSDVGLRRRATSVRGHDRVAANPPVVRSCATMA